MDPRHLEPDELAIEFAIRHIDNNAESALEILKNVIDLEQSSKRDKPKGPHALKISTELVLCKRKIAQIDKDRQECYAKSDFQSLIALRSRTIHLVDRLERLQSYATDNHAVPLILEDARGLEARLAPNTFENLSNNGVDDEEFAGFGPTGATALPSDGRNAATAAYVPTVDSHANVSSGLANQVSSLPGQLTSWGVDPSIIATGLANSVPKRVVSNDVLSDTIFQSFVRPSPSGHSSGAISKNYPPNGSSNLPATRQSVGGNANTYHASTVHEPIPQPDRTLYSVPPPLSEPVYSNTPPANHQQPGAPARSRAGLTHTLSKWTVKFGGGAKDLAVDEFFFRVENLAAADHVHADSLVLGLHVLLTGNASDFYWVQRRKYPNHSWAALKRAMIAHFAKQETDLEIRKLIMERRQVATEGFGDFCLAVECLAARLTRPMDDIELVEILRQNMSDRLQTCLLLHHTPNVDSLKASCRKFERLWATQSQFSKARTFNRRMAELGFDDGPAQVSEIEGGDDLCVRESPAVNGSRVNSLGYEVSALSQAKPPNRSEYLICWNCDDIGHSFMDCSSTDRKIFCYGCGAKNVYKPTCKKCSAGNPKPGGIITGRSCPNPFAPSRSSPSQQSK